MAQGGWPSVAMCLSGELRSFPEVHVSLLQLRKKLRNGLDVFMFVRAMAGGWNEAEAGAITAVSPMSIRTYTDADFRAAAPSLPTPCFCAYENKTEQNRSSSDLMSAATHFSYNGVQFWAIHRCFNMMRRHESVRMLAAGSLEARYKWVMRARPDVIFQEPQLRNIPQVTGRGERYEPVAHAWYRRQHVSDVFALLSRAAADAYGEIWYEFLGGCSSLPPLEERARRCHQDIWVPEWWSIECLIYSHLSRPSVNVSVTIHDGMRPLIVRHGKNGSRAATVVNKTAAYFVCPRRS